MEITTKLKLGSQVVRFFDGAIQALEVISVDYKLCKGNAPKGGEVSYSAVRKDSAYDPRSQFEKPWIDFTEAEIGRTIFLTKEDLVKRLTELPVDNGRAQR